MQRPEEELIGILKKSGVDFTASLPCEKIKTLLQIIERCFHHVPLTREEEGVGICAGAALSGRRPAMFVQSSGIGNMINALLSLTQFYELPLAVFVSRRGVYKEKIEAQLPMGRKLPAILSGAGITSTEINAYEDLGKIGQELPGVYSENRIHAFLISPRVWENSECGVSSECSVRRLAPSAYECEDASAGCSEYEKKKGEAESPRALLKASLTRYDIIKEIAPHLEGKVVVCNLGWPSKELYAVKHQPSNFYMLGSMGMVSPIGLGIALTSKKEVVAIDGDGSILMNPGTLATAASLSPKNLTIFCIDNGAYGSTGDQPTLAGSCVDLEQVAQGLGIRYTSKASTEKEIVNAIGRPREGLTFIHALAIPGNNDVPNIPLHHHEIRRLVQEVLRK